MSATRRWISTVVALCIGYAGLVQGAQAALVGTEAVAAAQTASTGAQQRLAATLDRADVVQALAARGVDVDQARERVAALDDAQAAALLAQIDAAPAGGDVLGTVVFIFVLLLVTDILGLTKVFPFTRSVR